jgi:hypothetical protein
MNLGNTQILLASTVYFTMFIALLTEIIPKLILMFLTVRLFFKYIKILNVMSCYNYKSFELS